jgi:hypothetical protein
MRREHQQRELERAGATAWKASRIALDIGATRSSVLHLARSAIARCAVLGTAGTLLRT